MSTLKQHIGVRIDESTDPISIEGNDRAFELLDQLQKRGLTTSPAR
jgi:hypothetical protein